MALKNCSKLDQVGQVFIQTDQSLDPGPSQEGGMNLGEAALFSRGQFPERANS